MAQSNIAKTKKQKYELERGEKFLRFTICDCDQGFEEWRSNSNSQQQQFGYDLRRRIVAALQQQ